MDTDWQTKSDSLPGKISQQRTSVKASIRAYILTDSHPIRLADLTCQSAYSGQKFLIDCVAAVECTHPYSSSGKTFSLIRSGPGPRWCEEP